MDSLAKNAHWGSSDFEDKETSSIEQKTEANVAYWKTAEEISEFIPETYGYSVSKG